MALNARQQRFVAEYLIDLNAAQAALRAGYAESTARNTAYRWVSPLRERSTCIGIWDAVNKALTERNAQCIIKQEQVLAELARIAFVDIRDAFNPDGTLKPVQGLPEDVARAVAAFEVTAKQTSKIKLLDKHRALDLLGRHLRLFSNTADSHTLSDTNEVRRLSDPERINRINALFESARARRDRPDTD